jgi:hypothetical protein
LMVSIYAKSLYSVMSETVHKREDLNIRDGEFVFSMVEDYMDFILDRTIKG